VEDTVNHLESKGHKMSVISNMDLHLGPMLQQARLMRYFDFVLSSLEANCAKPDPIIFPIALEKNSLAPIQPSHCCHVGDTYKTDYMGAEQAGWNIVLINELSDTPEQVRQCKNISKLSSLRNHSLIFSFK
jgi:HAD superfamily hydrolase (TIGR01549 family)